MKQPRNAGPPRRKEVVVPTQLRLDQETRAMLDEHRERRGGTLHAAATEVFHAGFRVLAEQAAALEDITAGDLRHAEQLRDVRPSLSGKGYGPFGFGGAR